MRRLEGFIQTSVRENDKSIRKAVDYLQNDYLKGFSWLDVCLFLIATGALIYAISVSQEHIYVWGFVLY